MREVKPIVEHNVFVTVEKMDTDKFSEQILNSDLIYKHRKQKQTKHYNRKLTFRKNGVEKNYVLQVCVGSITG